MKTKITFFSMALLIAFSLLGCSSDDENSSSSSSLVPRAPFGDKTQYLEVGSTVSDIKVTGSNINWYLKSSTINTQPVEVDPQNQFNNLTNMVWIPSDTEIKSNTTYYATQTVNNIQSRTFLPVTVYVFER